MKYDRKSRGLHSRRAPRARALSAGGAAAQWKCTLLVPPNEKARFPARGACWELWFGLPWSSCLFFGAVLVNVLDVLVALTWHP